MLGRLSTILLLVVVVGSASAERVTLEFEDAPIADILVAIGRAAGVAVVPDETVTGNASYYAREVESSEALAEAAARFDLFVTAHEGVRAVSAVRIGEDESGRLSVEAGAI